MDGSNRHHHERALAGPHGLGPSQKLQFAFQDVKALLMGMMDMRRRGGSMRSHFKFSEAQCSPRMRPILLDHHVNRTERKRAPFSRLQYDDTHDNILSCLLTQATLLRKRGSGEAVQSHSGGEANSCPVPRTSLPRGSTTTCASRVKKAPSLRFE